MEIVQISSQFYVVMKDGDSLRIVDGPYPEPWMAASMARLRDMD